MSAYLPSLAGGALIGLSVALFMLLNGRIAGISGLVGGLLRPPASPGAWATWSVNAAFAAGLVLGPVLYLLVFGGWPVVTVRASVPVLVAGGLLVGFGTRLGSGCTSGHGVAGLARLSPRSMAAVATFLATGIATVALMTLAGVQ